MTESNKPAHPLKSLASIIGAVGGWAFSQYCRGSGWIPGLAAILLFILFTKTPLRPRFFGGTIIATGAHIIWFVIGTILENAWETTALDIVLMLAGVIWIWMRPGLAAAVFLGLIQVASLAINIYLLSNAKFGDMAHRALTAHCVFRLMAITGLVIGYLRWRKDRPGSIAGDAVPQDV